jgi:hypothetical protein
MRKILLAIALCLCVNARADVIDSWGSPVSISTSGVNASSPHVGIDSNGNSVAIWLENDALMANTLPAGGSWGTSVTLASSGASSPHLVVDPAGNATAMWLEGGLVLVATLPAGSTWGTPFALSSSGSVPHLAVRSNGDVVAIWLTGSTVEFAYQLFGGSWSSTQALSGPGAIAPQIAIGANGTVAATWHTVNSITSINNAISTTSSIGGSWSTPTIVSEPTIDSVYTQVAVDSNGNTIATWFTYFPEGDTSSNVSFASSYLPVSGIWSIPTTISKTLGNRNPVELMSKVMFTSTGDAMAIWTNGYGSSEYALFSSQTANGQSWDREVIIVIDYNAYAADLGVNALNDAFVVYMAFDPPSSTVAITSVQAYVETFNSNAWVNPILLSGSVNNGFPKLAVVVSTASVPYATALWVNFNGTNNNIQAAVASGSLIVPPSDVTITQSVDDFGVFQQYNNTISWDPSPDPNVILYVI